MLTPDQIKNLKPGDKIIAELQFLSAEYDGINVETPNGTVYFFRLSNRECFSMPPASPNYSPTRLFKKGDIVRLKEWNGRLPSLPEVLKFDNGLFKVHADENYKSSVEITRENSEAVYIAPICFLELVTPVEELAPYSVHAIVGDNGKISFFAVRKGDVSVAAFFCDTSRAFTEEQARAAAHAERDRLNAEFRKEHEND